MRFSLNTSRYAPWCRAALAGFVLLAVAGCKADLYSNLGEREAVEMMAVLLRHGIDAARTTAKDGSSTIQVEKDRLAEAVEVLRAHQYPRRRFATMGEVFQQQGLIASPTEERGRFIYALGQELSHTISEIDGVVSARVHVVLPHNDPLRQGEAPAAAAVFVRHDADAELTTILPQIKQLVAHSIEGLSYDKVTVVLLPVKHPPPASLPPPPPRASGWTWPELDGLTLGAGGAVAVFVLGAGGLIWRRRVATRAAAVGSPLPGAV